LALAPISDGAGKLMTTCLRGVPYQLFIIGGSPEKKMFFSRRPVRSKIFLQIFFSTGRSSTEEQGCQMVYFHTKNFNFGTFWRVLECKLLAYFYDHLEYFTTIWYILWPLGIVCVHLVLIYRFGMFGPRKIWQPGRFTCAADESLFLFSQSYFRFSFFRFRREEFIAASRVGAGPVDRIRQLLRFLPLEQKCELFFATADQGPML
jgi:hypothetical protein